MSYSALNGRQPPAPPMVVIAPRQRAADARPARTDSLWYVGGFYVRFAGTDAEGRATATYIGKRGLRRTVLAGESERESLQETSGRQRIVAAFELRSTAFKHLRAITSTGVRDAQVVFDPTFHHIKPLCRPVGCVKTEDGGHIHSCLCGAWWVCYERRDAYGRRCSDFYILDCNCAEVEEALAAMYRSQGRRWWWDTDDPATAGL